MTADIDRIKDVSSEFLNTRFEELKTKLNEELEAEKELMLFDFISSLTIPEDRAKEIAADLKKTRIENEKKCNP